jgi:formylglycine-generating enzyme
MVILPQGYSIDSTEVTRGQYRGWVEAHGGSVYSSDPPYGTLGCSGVIDKVGPCMSAQYEGSGWENYPQGCVSWCQASQYCNAVGKRLCGKIGESEPVGYGDYADASLSQWYNACVSGGANYIYPYGNTYQSSYCNFPLSVGLVPVGSMASCQSDVEGYMGVYDLSGNVAEWEASCSGYDGGQGDSCRTRDGACGSSGVQARATKSTNIGFRCCSR